MYNIRVYIATKSLKLVVYTMFILSVIHTTVSSICNNITFLIFHNNTIKKMEWIGSSGAIACRKFEKVKQDEGLKISIN